MKKRKILNIKNSIFAREMQIIALFIYLLLVLTLVYADGWISSQPAIKDAEFS